MSSMTATCMTDTCKWAHAEPKDMIGKQLQANAASAVKNMQTSWGTPPPAPISPKLGSSAQEFDRHATTKSCDQWAAHAGTPRSRAHRHRYELCKHDQQGMQGTDGAQVHNMQAI